MSKDRLELPLRRPARLPSGAPLDYEPNNEQGVVYLFSHLARKRFGLHIERVQAGFPDCVAYRAGKRVRVEFEFRSRNFALHRHDPKGCDWIVCWIHDWPAKPDHLHIIELRREYGLGFNVWFQPVGGTYRDTLRDIRFSDAWSVPSTAIEGDLLLFYRTAPESLVADLFRLSGPVKQCRAGWKPGQDWMGPIRRVASLKAPIHLSDLRAHPLLKNAGFVRGNMQRRYRASEYWAEIHRMIVARNPSVARLLKKYGPERLS